MARFATIYIDVYLVADYIIATSLYVFLIGNLALSFFLAVQTTQSHHFMFGKASLSIL